MEEVTTSTLLAGLASIDSTGLLTIIAILIGVIIYLHKQCRADLQDIRDRYEETSKANTEALTRISITMAEISTKLSMKG